MKKILIILALFCFTMSFANLSFAQTPGAVTCEITDPDTGVTAKDTDCDNVADENDNCPEVRNGDCEDSESFCDTDDNGELDSFEIAGGCRSHPRAVGSGALPIQSLDRGFWSGGDRSRQATGPQSGFGDWPDRFATNSGR